MEYTLEQIEAEAARRSGTKAASQTSSLPKLSYTPEQLEAEAVRRGKTASVRSSMVDLRDVLADAPMEATRNLFRSAASIAERIGVIEKDTYKDVENWANKDRAEKRAGWSEGKRLATDIHGAIGPGLLASAVGGSVKTIGKAAQVAKTMLEGGALSFFTSRDQESEVGNMATGALVSGFADFVLQRAAPTAAGAISSVKGIPQTLKEATNNPILGKLSDASEYLFGPNTAIADQKAAKVGKILEETRNKSRPSGVGKSEDIQQEILSNADIIQRDIQSHTNKLSDASHGKYETLMKDIDGSVPKANSMTDGFDNLLQKTKEQISKDKSKYSEDFLKYYEKVSSLGKPGEPKTALEIHTIMRGARQIAEDAAEISRKDITKMSREEVGILKEAASWAENDLQTVANKAGKQGVFKDINDEYRDVIAPARSSMFEYTNIGNSAPGVVNVDSITKILEKASTPKGLNDAQKLVANLSPEGKKAFTFDVYSRVLAKNSLAKEGGARKAAIKLKDMSGQLGLTMGKEDLKLVDDIAEVADTMRGVLSQSGKDNKVFLDELKGLAQLGGGVAALNYAYDSYKAGDNVKAIATGSAIALAFLTKGLLTSPGFQSILVKFPAKAGKEREKAIKDFAIEYVTHGMKTIGPQIIHMREQESGRKNSQYPQPSEMSAD